MSPVLASRFFITEPPGKPTITQPKKKKKKKKKEIMVICSNMDGSRDCHIK